MNINSNNYDTLLTLKKALSKNKNEDAVFTKKDLQDLAKSDDKNVRAAANQVLKDNKLFKLIDNSFSDRENLNNGTFVLGELNAALISLNPKNAYRADIEALKIIKNELVSNHEQGPWSKDTLEELKKSQNDGLKAAANRILKDPQLLGLANLGNGSFQAGELDAAIANLDPLNPQVQDIDALKTILKEVEKSPNQEISKEELTRLATTSNKDNPALRAAARRLLNAPGLLWLTDSDAAKAQNDSQIKFQPWELKTMIKDLNPLSPKMLDVSALRTLASAVKARPDQAITKEQLQQIADDPAGNPSVRAAANRILNNPEMLEFVDNAFATSNESLIRPKNQLNDGKIHAGELLAVAHALHPLSASSRNLDTLQTIKDEILAHPETYPNGVMTRDQIIKLQQSNSPDLRQAENRLFNNKNLGEMLDTAFAPIPEGFNNKFNLETLDVALKALSPYSKNVQVTQALKVLAREINSDQTKYPNQQITQQQIKDLVQNGPPSLRQALATLIKDTKFFSSMSSISLQDIDDGLQIHNPIWNPRSFQAILDVYDYLIENKYDLKKTKIDDALLSSIIEKTATSNTRKDYTIYNSAQIALEQAPVSLKLIKGLINYFGH